MIDMLIKWTPALAIDNGILDGDHKEIIGSLNAIIAAVLSGASAGTLASMMDDLSELAAQHFQREEQLQSLLTYPGLAARKQQHTALLESLGRIGRTLRDASSDQAPHNPAQLKAFLHHWIVSHIIESDLKMQPYLHSTAA
jgi:hemerythrin